MIETLRTTQIAFLIRNAFWVSGGAEARYKKYSCKGPCKGKSYETTCQDIVSRYQTLVSSLPRETVYGGVSACGRRNVSPHVAREKRISCTQGNLNWTAGTNQGLQN